MKRGQFLTSLGAALTAPFALPLTGLGQGRLAAASTRSNCVLVPSETPGPFPLDLTESAFFFRQEIHEDRAGVRLRQRIRILGADNREPLPNVRVNIWHCDGDGDYSGYAAMNLRDKRIVGYQITDAIGECEFVTIFRDGTMGV